jgi:hypothetical protein
LLEGKAAEETLDALLNSGCGNVATRFRKEIIKKKRTTF